MKTKAKMGISCNGGTPKNHPFESDFPLESVCFGYPHDYGTPQILKPLQLALSTGHRAIHIADALQLAGGAGGLGGSVLILGVQ